MKIGIIGLGLIGGSLGRTIVNRTTDTVYAFDISKKAMLDGKLLSAYHKPLKQEDVRELDVVFFSLYPDALENALDLARKEIELSGGRIDYVTALDVDTLEEPADSSKGLLVAAAVFYGTTRLIDNEVIELKK